MTTADRDLIHSSIDGVATDDERVRLEELLASDTEARHLYDALAATQNLLHELPLIEPSVDLKQRILAALPPDKYKRAGLRHQLLQPERPAIQRSHSHPNREKVMNRKTLFATGAIALVVVLYFAVDGVPPAERVSGTMAGDSTLSGIQPAERYRAGQITGADVKLDDATINNLLQDPDVVSVLQNSDFRTAVEDGSLMEALKEPNFLKSIEDGSLTEALKNADFRTALGDGNLTEALQNTDFLTALGDGSLINALQSTDFLKAIEEGSLKDALANADFLKALEDGSLTNALKNDDFLKSIGEGSLKDALTNADFLKALEDGSLKEF